MKKSYVIFLLLLGICIGLVFSGTNVIIPLGLLAFLTATTIVLTEYETALYILAGYGVIDYVLRLFVPFMSSIWDEAFMCGLVLLWIWKWLVFRKDSAYRHSPVAVSLIGFISVMLIVLITNSPDFSIGLEGFRVMVQYTLWYFVVIQLVKDNSTARRICIIFALITGLMALHGVYQFVVGAEMPAGWVDRNEAGVRTRVYSILTSPNIFGSLLTLATPITTSIAISTRDNKGRIIFGGLALAMAASLVFTFSRGAWIGFMVAFCAYVLIKDKRLIIPGIIMAVLVVVLVPSVGNRITYMLSPEYIESSLRGGRLIRWITGLRILSFFPFMGVGLGHFGGAVAMNHGLSTMLDGEYTETFYMDNYYLKTAVETGVFGGVAMLMLMYCVFISCLRTVKSVENKAHKELSVGIMSGLCGVMVHNFVENVFEVPMMASLFWLFVGVIMAVWYNSRKEEC